MTENSIPAQASDEPMQAAFESWAWQEGWSRDEIAITRTADGYTLTTLQEAWRVWGASYLAAQSAAPQSSGNTGELAPRATADVEKLRAALSTAVAAVLREAMDEFTMHPCDVDNYDLRAQKLYGPMADLYAALKAQPALTEAATHLCTLDGSACGMGGYCKDCSAPTEAQGEDSARLAAYTCIGKGGEYEVIGTALGAGTLKSSGRVRVYRDTASGELFYRTLRDFEARMELMPDIPETKENA